MRKQHIVALATGERALLLSMVKKGRESARVITRARILLMADGREARDKEICAALQMGAATPHRVRKRYCTEGIKSALYDRKRPGREPAATPKEQATIVAIACTNPPDGASRWTLDLLTEKVKKDVKHIGRSTIHRILLSHDTKPWREKNVVRTRS
jgi:transposase